MELVDLGLGGRFLAEGNIRLTKEGAFAIFFLSYLPTKPLAMFKYKAKKYGHSQINYF